jgi:7-cyano-7-deazaguanine synthase in queuosine biosynthesis
MILKKIYKKSPKDIWGEILKNPINNKITIDSIEKILIKRRGYVFKIPKKNEPVIALISGGMDTLVVIAILLHVYKLRVFPLFINRKLPHEKRVKESIKFFTKYFKRKYPSLYNDPFEIVLSIPPTEIKNEIIAKENDIIKNQNRKGVPMQPSIYANNALLYSKYLESKYKVKAKSIFGGWLPSNSEWYGYESFTSLRSIMLNLCIVDDDFTWQFTSLAMEKELGFYFDKDTLVKIGNDLKVEMEKSWTCFKGDRHQCGKCPPCWMRRNAFKKARVTDKTIYKKEIDLHKNFMEVKKILKNVKKIFLEK